MKAADAKKPQFDAAWWKKAKAKPADPKGLLEKALKTYEEKVKYFFSQTKNSGSGQLDEVVKALNGVKKEATAEKGNKNLGAFQKETLEALNNYIKISDAALKEIERVEKSPIMNGAVQMLIKSVPQFKEYCTKNYQAESYNFLSLMYKGAKKRFVYDDFIKPGSKFEVNITGGTSKAFQAIEKKIQAGESKDDDSTWKAAPWDKAEDEIEAMLRKDVIPRFQHFTSGVLLKDELP